MTSPLSRLYWTAFTIWHLPGQYRYPYASAARIAGDRDRNVRRMVRYAYRHVPYYRQTMDQLGLSPDDLRTFDDLQRLPLISVSDLQARPEIFRSTALSDDNMVALKSGGSTGSPHTVWHDPHSQFTNIVVTERERRLHQRLIGKGWRYHTLNIASSTGHSVLMRRGSRQGALWPRWLGLRRDLVEDWDGLEPIIDKLNALHPDLLGGFGSTIADLFVRLDAQGQPFHHPRLVHYASDALPPAVRELLTARHGIEVFSAYQCVEALKLGWECEAHAGYHVNADQYPVRIVDEQGRELPAGQPGEIVVSNLVNRGTVLLNYRLGDVAALQSEPCPCGRNLPRLSWVEGRVVDAFTALDGRRVPGRVLDRAVRERGGVWQYQAVQPARDRIVVRLRPQADCDQQAVASNITAALRRELGAQLQVEVSFVDELARTAAGKRRYILNETLQPGADRSMRHG